ATEDYASPSLLPDGEREVATGVLEIGLDRQRLLKVVDRLVQPALDPQRDAEVVVRLHGARRQLQRRAERGDRLFGAIELEKQVAEIVVRGSGRVDPRGASELID